MPRDRFEALFEAHHRALLAYAARRCPTLADAEDAVAEVFVVAWRRLDDLPDGDAARLWLYGVARRTLANQRRGRARGLRLVERLRAMAGTPVAVISTPAEPTPALDALARLSPGDQEILRLVAWEDLSHVEIAAVLDISVNAVAIRLHRARARFEEALAPELKDSSRWRTWHWSKGSPGRRPSREKT
jgi:RNA polymerase sigma-70 factor (ECF subfamily)